MTEEEEETKPLWCVWLMDFHHQSKLTYVRAVTREEAVENWSYVNEEYPSSTIQAEVVTHEGEADKIVRNWEVL